MLRFCIIVLIFFYPQDSNGQTSIPPQNNLILNRYYSKNGIKYYEEKKISAGTLIKVHTENGRTHSGCFQIIDSSRICLKGDSILLKEIVNIKTKTKKAMKSGNILVITGGTVTAGAFTMIFSGLRYNDCCAGTWDFTGFSLMVSGGVIQLIGGMIMMSGFGIKGHGGKDHKKKVGWQYILE
jgi:hypothetical protein